ncbi:MAG TPA: dTDP-4-dehydrorhamnose reductase [Mycobacteriales bacterium]|nr:dTDP-4-dehydrorhamnose reductase [Mycobacteriales bacterium]
MRIFVTGSYGQLGTDLQRIAAERGIEVAAAVDVDTLDITDLAAVRAALDTSPADVLVNAAAFTAVDAAEEKEDLAYAVNATGPANLAIAAGERGMKLVHVSTDYVFPGDRVGGPPYDVDDETGPKTAYGRTKLAGDLAVREAHPDGSYVVRTAWVYGIGNNFVRTMARLSKDRDTVTVVDDQRGSPTWSLNLAQGLLELAASEAAPGTYHLTGGGDCTWFEFAQAIFTELGLDPARVQPTSSEAFGSKTPRPPYSVLSPRAWVDAGLTPPPHWRDALAQAFADPEVGPRLRAG